MDRPETRRVKRELSTGEAERRTQHRAQIARELPEMIARDQMRKEAREESTLSGELRRTIDACELSIATIAARVGVTPDTLDEFLTGERTLRSDVLDRLARVLGDITFEDTESGSRNVTRHMLCAGRLGKPGGLRASDLQCDAR
jgi:transcriptional regulator with XRE-family HTH domain